MTKHSLLNILSFVLLLNSVCFLSSCKEEEIESLEVETLTSTHTCRMTFDVDFTGFDVQDGTTRASIHGWDNGDVVYLSFTTSDNRTVGGEATYDAANDDWTVTYTGTLSSTEQGSVKVYYYDGEVTKSGNTLSIDPTVGVYADLKGSYKYSRENGVNVSASLSPQTSRIRFKGDPGKAITVSGINSFAEYNQQTGALTATLISSSVTVSSDGFTPYIYGVFADTSKPSISINSEGCRFTKVCSSSMFQIGESGWMNVPTRAAHENWEMEDMREAHAVLTDYDKDGIKGELIFYFDEIDHSREGIVFEVNKELGLPSWYEYVSRITNVIFEPDFIYVKPTYTSSWFVDCSKLTSISGIKYLDTSAVTDMSGMFFGCSSLTSLDLSNFNTTAVTDMRDMFYGCSSLTSLDLSSFNTSSVTDMSGMFWECSSLTSLDLSCFNTSSVTDMSFMFYICSSLTSLDVSSFNTAAVTNMRLMFCSCSDLTNLDVSGFDTGAVTNMDAMFCDCTSLTSLDVSSFNTAAVTQMSSMFEGCSHLTSLDVSSFNTAAVTNMSWMFERCSRLTNLDLSNFNTTAVTDMSGMFGGWFVGGCSSLTNLNLSSFNTASVKDMSFMFAGCSSLSSLDLSSFNTASVINMGGMFIGCSNLTNLDLHYFNTAAVTGRCRFETEAAEGFAYMFAGCSSLTSLDLSNFNTAAATRMDYMFGGCSSLTSLDLSSFNTAVVSDMRSMFNGCSSLSSLDLSSFNTAAVTSMNGMFKGCSSLTSFDISNFVISAETDIKYLLWGCSNLSSIKVGRNDFSVNDATNTVFDGVGKSSNPCNLIIDSGFDKSVLGSYNGSYYYWRGGYFAEPIANWEIIIDHPYSDDKDL